MELGPTFLSVLNGTGLHFSQHFAGLNGTGPHISQRFAGVNGTGSHISQHFVGVNGTGLHDQMELGPTFQFVIQFSIHSYRLYSKYIIIVIYISLHEIIKICS